MAELGSVLIFLFLNTVVLASTPDLQSGFSRDLFIAWCGNPKNSIVLTTRTSPGTLARELIDNPQLRCITIDVQRRVELEGIELEDFLRKKQEKDASEAKSKANNSVLEELESSDESESEMELEGLYQNKGKHDLMMKPEGKAKSGFFKQAKKSYPMFHFHEEKIRWDEYGEIIKPEDYTIAENVTAEEEVKKPEKTFEEEAMQENADLPTKCVASTVTLDVNARIQYIDFEGRSDGESMRKILERVKPRQLVLVRGTPEATDTLAEYCTTSSLIQGTIFKPRVGHTIDATTESRIFQAKLRDHLVTSLNFAKAKDIELAWIDAQLTYSQHDEDSMEDGQNRETDMVPLLDCLPPNKVPTHNSVFINEPKLSDFKLVLLQEGIPCEFVAGVLICNNMVAVKRNEAGRIQLEGTLCNEYFRVRELLYQQYAIV
ncbi:hypothetical protein LOTGIDRAFT_234977 [Lottia gigantea]|uniref:Cleavage and polyadenylation specificity factor subunit 2 n=1 Tax=Lottia gigantea TaxID=225164 RepID=V3Z9V2_LOTGI|nr:hypothetical protein LOTGIDRAFT_234977 [Lottia gigantea]ESO87748.1 hypothetical protein LOTGIDRAFT_234977 [Lottia gigantea]